MADAERELSTLECMLLGLISTGPQSGYSIISTLESGAYRWSASPGSIYPILKRLEKEKYIAGEIEMVHETRPRKMYKLKPLGEAALDTWLREPMRQGEALEKRDIALIKFLFAEQRLSREEVIAWLDSYEKLTDTYDAQRRIWHEALLKTGSLHQQLIQEATMMELNMQRAWIQMARRRLQSAP